MPKHKEPMKSIFCGHIWSTDNNSFQKRVGKIRGTRTFDIF